MSYQIMNYKENIRYLYQLIPESEMKRVLSSDAQAEIDGYSLTCLDYKPLANLIPLHWTVVDFGCSYNAQSYLFEKHKCLISVDLPMSRYEPDFHLERFKPEWCHLYEIPIEEWLDKHLDMVDIDETFAICGYVPANPEVIQRVKNSFKNLFIYYPSNKKAWSEII